MKQMIENMKKKWLAYLDKMAKANQKQFGSKRLDCCDLNNEKNLHKR